MTVALAISREEAEASAWKRGELSWLLDPFQLQIYERYREWEKQPTAQVMVEGGRFDRIFVLDIARRVGKTTIIFIIQLENGIRNVRSQRYATAYQKDIAEIVDDVSLYIFETCPPAFRPEFKTGSKARPAGWYFPANGSVIKAVGLDQNPEGLRGLSSDGDAISEAAFTRRLTHNVKSVLYPQYQGRPHARLILESSAPKQPGTEYDTLFVEDAKKRGAYFFATIDDNPRLSEAERDEFIEAMGGRDHPDCRREYYCERVAADELRIVPEFKEELHVKTLAVPEYAHCYVGIDPGMRDQCAIIWAYWDFERQKLCIQRAWSESNANTEKIAGLIKETEAELWSELEYCQGDKMRSNPLRRVSDTDLRLLGDLRTMHGIHVMPADKTDAEAALSRMRTAMARGEIEIDDCDGTLPLRDHLRAGLWNANKTSYDRSEVHGHYDLIDALKYLYRHLSKQKNPVPSAHVLEPTKFTLPKHRETARSEVATAIETAMPKQSWQRGQRKPMNRGGML